MGFNLKLLFEELEELLTAELSDDVKLKAIKETIEESKEYAEQCGML